MACNAHVNQNWCNIHSNVTGGEQPCPSNIVNYSKANTGVNIIAERVNKIRSEINREEQKRNFIVTQFANDVFISSLINSTNIQELRTSLDTIVNRNDYCWCNCNYSGCSCNLNKNIYCACDCNNCTCNCNYCTCNCNYCTCNCDYYCSWYRNCGDSS